MILVGAFAKSAQLPLHTWLPDAMEGPTPVSALIHAATMVTAGVYLIARCHPLFELAPTAADVGAIIGTATLVFAATVALAVTDLKRVIAYSTMSQIGYMVLGVSVAAYGAGMFHLMTHAFFKALLFMSAGSVIARRGRRPVAGPDGRPSQGDAVHVRGVHDRRARAGRLPVLLGLLLQGRDPGLHDQPRRRLRGARACSATSPRCSPPSTPFRMVFRVFFGPPVPEARELEKGQLAHGEHANPMTGEEEDTDVGFPGSEHHIAEREWPMRAAMAPLALLAIIGGRAGDPGRDRHVRALPRAHVRGLAARPRPPQRRRGVDRARGGRHRRRSPASSAPTSGSCARPELRLAIAREVRGRARASS